MKNAHPLIEVTAANVTDTGFFCKMSARGKPGYEQKRAWLDERFAEGLQLRLLGDGERGFVEFIPGDYAWRAIENAAEFMVIHCLWVVGRSKGKGFGRLLLEEVENYARTNGFAGVAAVASRGNWLVDPAALKHHGYSSIDSAAPSFDLMVKRFGGGTGDPRFCGGWQVKARARPKGLVVFRSAQCPYLDDAVGHARAAAEIAGVRFSEIHLDSAADIRARSPTPYGVYALVRDGTLISYHYLLQKNVAALIAGT